MKITKRQLRRIIKEEKAKLFEQGEFLQVEAASALEFAMDEYAQARAQQGMADGGILREEIETILNRWLSDVSLHTGEMDTSRWGL